MQITTYQTITNRTQTSSLKKLLNRTRIKLTKSLIERIEHRTNYEFFLQL
jgi:hypothetical protein